MAGSPSALRLSQKGSSCIGVLGTHQPTNYPDWGLASPRTKRRPPPRRFSIITRAKHLATAMYFKPAFVAAVASAMAAVAAADYTYPSVEGAFPGYNIVLNEEFTAPTLNASLWTPDWDCSGWGNGMRAAYTTSPKNLFIENGQLNLNPICGRLQPNKTICGPFTGYPECACEPTNANNMDATSAQITTRHKFAFNRGKFRVRAKMSTGYYTWPAFWLYRDWQKGTPMPISGEIDIMEGVGKRPQWWTAVIHYLTKDPATGAIDDKVRNENADWQGGNLNDSFHVYGLDWTYDGFMVWTIDEVVMWRLNYGRLMSDPNNINVFDDGFFYILLDVAVGGRMFGIGYGNKRPPYEELCADGNTFTPTIIDWVRVYQETGKNNFTTGTGPDTIRGAAVPGSAASTVQAACPFDGCVGTTWNQRVDDIIAASTRPTSTGGATAPTGSPATSSRPSGAASTAASVFVAVFALVAGLFVTLT
ncbi:concanavalin A-like lectin/glucanase domain-containing protein [Hyaloraphidium curvatum]|nr:concanavalin A-like lectin/glucanase domain-containing protein [Hyaloraphidium curvatum]